MKNSIPPQKDDWWSRGQKAHVTQLESRPSHTDTKAWATLAQLKVRTFTKTTAHPSESKPWLPKPGHIRPFPNRPGHTRDSRPMPDRAQSCRQQSKWQRSNLSPDLGHTPAKMIYNSPHGILKTFSKIDHDYNKIWQNHVNVWKQSPLRYWSYGPWRNLIHPIKTSVFTLCSS